MTSRHLSLCLLLAVPLVAIPTTFMSCAMGRAAKEPSIAEMTREIEVGMTLKEAQEIAEEKGFDCELIEEGDFTAQIEQKKGEPLEEELKDIRYLLAVRKDSSRFGGTTILQFKHLAIILDKDDCVTRVASRSVFLGP